MIGSNLGLPLPFTPPSPPLDLMEVEQIGLPLAFGQDALVAVGDRVLVGQAVAESCGGAAAMHSSVSGIVTEIAEKNCHFGRIVPTIFVENDGEHQLYPAKPKVILTDETREELLDLLDDRGVTDQEGRSLAVVLAARHQAISTLILCAMDQEPFLATEDGAICFYGDEVLSGLRVLQRLTKSRETVVALSAQQKTALDLVGGWVGRSLRVAVLAGNYPQGAPKLLAELVGACDFCQDLEEAGVLVVTATTALQVARALYGGRGVTRNLVSIANSSGAILVDAPLGILTKNLLDFGGYRGESVVLGGPMQGIVLSDLSVPVVAGMGGFSLLRQFSMVNQTPCIRCGNCAKICPVGLRPYAKGRGRSPAWDRCLHCGACQYVCPAGRLGQPKKEVACVG